MEKRASGALAVDQAAQSTPAAPSQTRAVLDSSGYEDGYERVWTNDSGFVTVSGYTFGNTAGASSLVSFERSQLEGSLGGVVNDVASIPGGWSYVLFSSTRAQSRDVFCQGVWFAAASRAFAVTTCGATPNSEVPAIQIATTQYERTGAAAPTISPT